MAVTMQFIDSMLFQVKGSRVKLADVYQSYFDWCSRTKTYPLTKRSFSTSLRDHGFVVRQVGHKNITVVEDVMLQEEPYSYT